MSYRFEMCFKSCKSLEDAVKTANNFIDICKEHAKEFIEDNKFYIPSRRKELTEKPTSEDEYWLYCLFNFKFVYWKEYKLLGLCGDCYPKEALEIFDTVHDFQNSCDQDYDFDTWSNKIELFKEMKENLDDLSDNELADYYESKKEDIIENIEYYKKSYLYEKIFEKLALDTWLYGKKDALFERITMNAIDSQETYFKMQAILRKVMYHAYQEEIEEMKNGPTDNEYER